MSNSTGPIWTAVAAARRAHGDIDGARQAVANQRTAAASNLVRGRGGRRSSGRPFAAIATQPRLSA